MTTNLVKWWKTRFLNGYKQFTVLMPADSCSESGRRSDTEELLSSISAVHSPPPRAPASATPSTPRPEPCCCGGQAQLETNTPRRELKFEEFECDVAVQGEEDEATVHGTPDKCRQCGPPRQEFSFTLYDLDGHGKITKDDIAGLVTTIYDTLGATIQVPHSGSKTIRVRLTVAPESRVNNTPQKSTNCSPHKPEDSPIHKPSCNKESLYHNLSPSKLANNAEHLYSQLNFSPTNKSKNEVYYSINNPNNNISNNSESVHYCSRKSPTLGHKVETVRVCNNESCSHNKTTVNSRLLNNDESSRLCPNIPSSSPKPSVRFCNNETVPQHNNAPLINLDSPLTTKKLSTGKDKTKSCSTPNSPHRPGNTRASLGVASPRTSGRKLASHIASPARSRRRTISTSVPVQTESLGSVGRERANSGTLQRQELLHIIQTNMEKNLLALQHNSTTHHRKRGEDATGTSHTHHRHHSTAGQRTNLPTSRRSSKTNATRATPRKTVRTTVDPTNNVISCSHYYLDLAGLESTDLCPHCDKGGKKGHTRSKSHDTTTHHLLRHKTRELDQARAMAQVVEWLQGAQLGGGKLPSNLVQEEEEEGDEEEEEQDDGEGHPQQTRTTHRHIHEHVHHHYHHYTDSQLVV